MIRKPKWFEEAQALREGGIPATKIAKKFGVSYPLAAKWSSKDWRLRVLRDFRLVTLKSIGFPNRPTKAQYVDFMENRNGAEVLEGFMSDRIFKQISVFNGANSKKGVQIECSKKQAKDCEKTADFFISTSGMPNPVHASNNFRNRGWLVGGGPRADICPKCQEFLRISHKKPEPTTSLIQKLGHTPGPAMVHTGINDQPIKEAPMVNPVPLVPKPAIPISQISIKDIGKVEKRLIDAELDEAYDATKGGYLIGNSDQNIAAKLGCPVEWVAIVRNEFHGPNTSIVDYKAELDAIKLVADEVRECKKQVDIAIDRLSAHDEIMNSKLKAYEAKTEAFQVAYNALMKKVNAL